MDGRSCIKAGLRLVNSELAHESCNLWNRLLHRVLDVHHPRCFPEWTISISKICASGSYHIFDSEVPLSSQFSVMSLSSSSYRPSPCRCSFAWRALMRWSLFFPSTVFNLMHQMYHCILYMSWAKVLGFLYS